MCIGAADDTKLEGIDAQRLCLREPELQRRSDVLVANQVVGPLTRPIPIPDLATFFSASPTIPCFEVGELIIRRNDRMGFTVALDLCYLHNGFPP